MENIEWPLFRNSMILFVIMALIALGFTIMGVYYQEEMSAKVAQMQKRIKSIRDKKRSQDEQLRLLGQLRPRFDAYQAKGVFDSEEPRLKWVENVREVEALLKLPAPVHFKLDVRKPFSPPFRVQKGRYELFASSMELTLGLLHEGDFLRFFKLLAKHGYGVYDVQSCAIHRTEDVVGLDDASQVAVHLIADCKINWYTMREKEKHGSGGNRRGRRAL